MRALASSSAEMAGGLGRQAEGGDFHTLLNSARHLTHDALPRILPLPSISSIVLSLCIYISADALATEHLSSSCPRVSSAAGAAQRNGAAAPALSPPPTSFFVCLLFAWLRFAVANTRRRALDDAGCLARAALDAAAWYLALPRAATRTHSRRGRCGNAWRSSAALSRAFSLPTALLCWYWRGTAWAGWKTGGAAVSPSV